MKNSIDSQTEGFKKKKYVTNNIRNNNNNSTKANLLTRRSNLDSVTDYCNQYESNHLFDSMNNFNSRQMNSSYANEVMPKSSSILTTNSIKTRKPSKLLPSMKSPNSSTSMNSDNLVIDLNSNITEVNNELPHPCTQTGCWRRFRTEKALNWHLKKFHQ